MASVPPPIPPGRGGGQGEGHNFAALISPTHQQQNNNRSTQQGVSGSASANRDNNNVAPNHNGGQIAPFNINDVGNIGHANNDLGLPNDEQGNAAAGSANNNGDAGRNHDNIFSLNGNNYDLSQDEFSGSSYFCTISSEHPYNPVHFGGDTRHVFEHGVVFRYISTPGYLTSFRRVKHPLTEQIFQRSQGEALITPVQDPDLVALIRELRRRSGENPDGPTDPITDEDRSQMDEMLRRLEDE